MSKDKSIPLAMPFQYAIIDKEYFDDSERTYEEYCEEQEKLQAAFFHGVEAHESMLHEAQEVQGEKDGCLTGYLVKIEGEETFVLAENMAHCFDKLRTMGYENFELVKHASYDVIK